MDVRDRPQPFEREQHLLIVLVFEGNDQMAGFGDRVDLCTSELFDGAAHLRHALRIGMNQNAGDVHPAPIVRSCHAKIIRIPVQCCLNMDQEMRRLNGDTDDAVRKPDLTPWSSPLVFDGDSTICLI